MAMDPGVCRRPRQRRARADSGRQCRGRDPDARAGAGDRRRGWPRRTTSWHRAQDARPLRRGAGRTCAPPPRSIRAIGSCSTRSGASSFSSGGSTKRCESFEQVLLVDPEDLLAHYNLMLCYQGLGRHRTGRAGAGALRALQGRRIGAGHHRPVPAQLASTTTTSGSRFTSTGIERRARRDGRLRLRRFSEPLAVIRACEPLAWIVRRAASAQPRRGSRRRRFTRCHGAGRHPVRPQQRRVRQEVPARNARQPASSCFDADGDGWQDLLFVNSTNWPGRPGGAVAIRRCTAINHDGTLRRRHARIRPRRRAVRHRRRRRRLRQRRQGRCLPDRARRQPPVPQRSAAASSPTSPRAAGVADARVSRPARSGSTTTTTASSICSSRTTSTGSIEKDLYCTLDGKNKSYCTPESYKGQSGTLYPQPRRRHLRGRDQASRACSTPRRRRSASRCSTSTATAGWTCSSRTTRSRIGSYRNKGNGTFADVAVGAGVAFSEAGVARAGMGVDAADYDGSGRPSLIIGNFSNEMMALYHNEGTRPVHRRGADARRIGRATSADADLRLLLLRLRPRRPARHLRRQRPRRRRHRARAVARHLRAAAAPVPQRRAEAVRGGRPLSRGRRCDGRSSAAARAYGDFDNDGDLDVVVTANNGPARLFRNDGGRPEQHAARADGRHRVEPRRHRRARRGDAAWRRRNSGRS